MLPLFHCSRIFTLLKFQRLLFNNLATVVFNLGSNPWDRIYFEYPIRLNRNLWWVMTVLKTRANQMVTHPRTNHSQLLLNLTYYCIYLCSDYENTWRRKVVFICVFVVYLLWKGVVNSAMSGDGSTEAMQFVLKDVNGATINCIFHQIVSAKDHRVYSNKAAKL